MILLCLASPSLCFVEVIIFPRPLFLAPNHRKTLSLCSVAPCPQRASQPSRISSEMLMEHTSTALAGLFTNWSLEQKCSETQGIGRFMRNLASEYMGMMHAPLCVIIISSPLNSKLVIITTKQVEKLRLKRFNDLSEVSLLASLKAKRPNLVSNPETLTILPLCL